MIFYTEGPFGESYFPAPVVGYSRVTVRTGQEWWINHSKKTCHRKVEMSFIPRVIFRCLWKYGCGSAQRNTSYIFSLTEFMSERYLATSQGFQIELNDMHGKPKATGITVKRSLRAMIQKDAFSGVRYDYDVENETSPVKSCRYFSRDQWIQPGFTAGRMVGVDVDMVMDSREMTSNLFQED